MMGTSGNAGGNPFGEARLLEIRIVFAAVFDVCYRTVIGGLRARRAAVYVVPT